MADKTLDIKKVLSKSPVKLEEKILKAVFKRNNCILDIIDIINYRMFSVPDYASIYTAMVSLYKKDSEINVETVQIELEGNNIFIDENIIKRLYNESYTSIKIKDTAEILKKLYQRRTTLSSIRGLIDDQEQHPSEYSVLLEQLNDIVIKSNELMSENRVDTKCCSGGGFDIIQDIEEKLNNKNQNYSLKTGFSVIDNDLGGFKPGNLITLCADSQVGKSMMALELALNMCQLNEDIHVMYQSLEMTKRECENRVISMLTDIEPGCLENPHKYFNRFNHLTQRIENILDTPQGQHKLEDFKETIKDAIEELYSYNLYIDDTPDLTTTSLEALVKKHHLKYGRVDVLFVDHMNILCSGSVSEEVSKLKEGYATLKKLAKKLNCVVICLHQFSNDGLKHDELRKPNIFSLIGGSAPRHFSDIIMGLWRPDVYREVIEKHPELKGYCDITWQKVRGSAKPDPTELSFNGYMFKEKSQLNYNNVVVEETNSEPDFITLEDATEVEVLN